MYIYSIYIQYIFYIYIYIQYFFIFLFFLFFTGDGFFYFAQEEGSEGGGLWSDYSLLEIGTKLAEINRPWREHINAYFKNKKSTSNDRN
jgi:hypothetical protein